MTIPEASRLLTLVELIYVAGAQHVDTLDRIRRGTLQPVLVGNATPDRGLSIPDYPPSLGWELLADGLRALIKESSVTVSDPEPELVDDVANRVLTSALTFLASEEAAALDLQDKWLDSDAYCSKMDALSTFKRVLLQVCEDDSWSDLSHRLAADAKHTGPASAPSVVGTMRALVRPRLELANPVFAEHGPSTSGVKRASKPHLMLCSEHPESLVSVGEEATGKFNGFAHNEPASHRSASFQVQDIAASNQNREFFVANNAPNRLALEIRARGRHADRKIPQESRIGSTLPKAAILLAMVLSTFSVTTWHPREDTYDRRSSNPSLATKSLAAQGSASRHTEGQVPLAGDALALRVNSPSGRAHVNRNTAATSSNSSESSPSAAKALARAMVGGRGWDSSQYSCLIALWENESHWNYRFSNSASGAYGIPQALPGSRMASSGSDWRTNPVTQIAWGLGYIADRYGDPCAAWSHRKSTGWY